MEGSSNEIIHGVVKPEMTQLDLPEILLEDNPNVSPRKRSSIFSLTIDEFEDKRGKDFGEMNMNDLLNDLWNAEGNSSTNPTAVANDGTETDPLRLSTQNSFSVPSPFCNKTLEEVWDEINRNSSPQENPNANVANGKNLQEGQQTLGEMTLEDFLVKVGIIQDGSALFPRPKLKESYQNSYGSLPNNGMYLGSFGGQGSMMTGFEHSQSNGENNMVVNGATTYPLYTTSGIFVGEGSDSIEENEKRNGVRIGINKGGENRRASTEQMELALERRRRRMIKNRESAARSRARKNAYTCELEHELNEQRKENAMLRLMLAESENKMQQVVLIDHASTKAHHREEKRKTLKRTLSVGW